MRFAVIDLGTNSVRFDVYQIMRGTRVQRLHREKVMVRLGQGVFLDGRLDRHAIRRTYLAFLRFKKIASTLHVQKFIAFGTSALRESQDSQTFIKFLAEKTGIDVRVITGLEEAHLIGRGVLENERLPKGQFAVVDIGGGSTEILVCRGRRILFAESFPLGTARLQQLFLKRSPPRPENVRQMSEYVRGTLDARLKEAKIGKVRHILGASGTIRALSNLVRKNGFGRSIEVKFLCSLNSDMKLMSTTELLGIPGMESDRVDMLLAGSLLLEEVALALKAKEILPTGYSLRDGILAEQLQLFGRLEPNQLSLHVEDLIGKSKRFGLDESSIRRTVAFAEKLFDQTQKLHRLKRDWRVYLVAATILRRTGEAISPSNHQEHSAYIVRNSQLPALDPSETELIALLCLYYDNKKVGPKKLPQLNLVQRTAFLKLLALLRVIDAFDSDARTKVELHGVRMSKAFVKLIYQVRPATDFELIRLDRKKSLFEKIFRRTLVGARL